MPGRPPAVVFVHGLAKKPPVDKLREIWDWGLRLDNPRPEIFPGPNNGIALALHGIASEFCYYADVFYGDEYETDYDAYYESNVGHELALDGLGEEVHGAPALIAITPREEKFLVDFEATLRANLTLAPDRAGASGAIDGVEIAGLLPGFVREAIIRNAAMEAYYFLFDKEFVRKDGTRFRVRAELRERLNAVLRTARDRADRVIVVSHSMGTMLAYDVLRNCGDCSHVDVLFTLGSPLGLREVQQELAASAGGVDFPAAKLGAWLNFYDPLDPICGAAPRFANDFTAVDGKSIQDVKESNWGAWRHAITHYFAGSKFRSALAEALHLRLE